MKKIKINSLLLLSSFFFLPSYSKPIESLILLRPNIITSSETYSATWKKLPPTISTIITFNTLTPEEMEIYYPTPKLVPIPSNEILENWFNQYSLQYGVSSETLRSIAYCESHYNPNAVNGIYGGMYQYSTSTWESTRNSMGENNDPSLRFNAEESIKTSAFKIAAGGIGVWPNCN